MILTFANISVLSSGNVSKYKFSTGKDVLPEKYLLEKAATTKRFEHSPLVVSWKNRLTLQKSQSDIAKETISRIRQDLWIQ